MLCSTDKLCRILRSFWVDHAQRYNLDRYKRDDLRLFTPLITVICLMYSVSARETHQYPLVMWLFIVSQVPHAPLLMSRHMTLVPSKVGSDIYWEIGQSHPSFTCTAQSCHFYSYPHIRFLNLLSTWTYKQRHSIPQATPSLTLHIFVSLKSLLVFVRLWSKLFRF